MRAQRGTASRASTSLVGGWGWLVGSALAPPPLRCSFNWCYCIIVFTTYIFIFRLTFICLALRNFFQWPQTKPHCWICWFALALEICRRYCGCFPRCGVFSGAALDRSHPTAEPTGLAAAVHSQRCPKHQKLPRGGSFFQSILGLNF